MLESVFRQLLACALEPRTPSVEAGGQCDPCRNAGFPLERLSPSPPYRCSTGFLGPECQLFVQVQDFHFLPQSRVAMVSVLGREEGG